MQIAQMAARLNQLYRQRNGLVTLLRNIRAQGGLTDRDRKAIDRILSSRRWQDEL